MGKDGLERQYEPQLRGREGARYVEVDARGRVVREEGARQDLLPEAAPPLHTNIDLDLQKFTVQLFGDSLIGGVVALEPSTGAVLALYSAPTFDPNRFIGGIPADYWRALNEDGRRPLYNKAIKGAYAPGSTWKLATAVTALEEGVATLDDHMPVACTGGYQYGNRRFRCWDAKGHGSVTLAHAIEVSCDVYFYQLGLKIGLSRLVAGGVSMGARERTGVDLPAETRSSFPTTPATEPIMTIEPWEAVSKGSAYFVARNMPSTFTRNRRWKSAKEVSSILPTRPIPALFTRTSSAGMPSNACLTASSSVMSQINAEAPGSSAASCPARA